MKSTAMPSGCLRTSKGDRVFHFLTVAIVSLLTLLVLLPLINILACSFSEPSAVGAGRVLLWPVDFTLDNYHLIFKYQDVWIGYRNTIFYTVAGTLINVAMSLLCAYPMSVKSFSGRAFFNKMFMFTMIFSGGMISNYVLMRNLKLLNTVWAILLPGAINVYNVIIMRTYIETSIPGELEEAARIDGCTPFRYFLDFVLPLAKPIIAVIAMYYAVAHWNSYFNAFLYLTDDNLYPLQLFLRQILLNSQVDSSSITDPDLIAAMQGVSDALKYVVIVVSTLPLMFIYPFVQKYFVKGVMIGSVKG